MHTVLLVDDEVYTRQGIRNLIDWESCGFQVTDEADNGEDALAIVRERKPDLVITDIRMPVMDGLELIRLTREMQPDNPNFIIISGYDDFRYAQQAIRFGVLDFVLKPIDENVLVQVLRKLNQVLTNDKMNKLQRKIHFSRQLVPIMISGEASEEQIDQWCRQQGIALPDQFRYVLVEVNDLHPWREQPAPGKDQLKRIISGCLMELQQTSDIDIHEHAKRFGFILPQRSLRGGELRAFADQLQIGLTARFNLPVYIYVGDAVAHLRELNQSYQSAVAASLYKFVLDDRVLIHERIDTLPLNYAQLEHSLTKELLEQVEERNISDISHTIDRIFLEFRKQHFSPEAVKLAIHHCVAALIDIMKQMGIEQQAVPSIEPMLGWHDMVLSPNELKRLFKAFMLDGSEWLAKHRKDSVKGTIQKIKAYIESHYQENISLKNIAAKFYMNPVYLGQLFKNTYGMYFNDFLLQIRVNESKKLLRQTDLRIYEIAERVGYSNADYFVTQFEKIEHMTPSEYRNKLL